MDNYDWFEIGEDYDRDVVLKAIDNLEWLELPVTVGMMPGENIKAIIAEFRIPKTSHIAVSNHLAPYGFYGIRAHYKNGSRELFFGDDGCACTPICSRLIN